MSRRRLLVVPSVATALLASVLPPTAGAASLQERTVRLTSALDGLSAAGDSQNPALSTTGRVVAYDSTAATLVASDPNGTVRDVFATDLVAGTRQIVSVSIDGDGADGPSSNPVISRDGRRTVFVSAATDLVAGDANGVTDIFARDAGGVVRRISTGVGGAEADGPSSEPDLSADGRFATFTSAATNLVPGDTNRAPDVFVHDLEQSTTTRLSVGAGGRQGDGRSSGPAISADGMAVAFESTATTLVEDDTNRVADVFVRDRRAGRTERVSRSSTGRQQDRSVAAPFRQVADISRDGRLVVFDSDATNLAAGDLNRRTDIFLADRQKGTVRLVSASSINVQGNNDSFAPRITPSGRHVTFESFASNLTPGQDGPREDIFVRDLATATTAVVSVTASGAPRERELIPQLLQRPTLTNNGQVAAFASTAPNLVAGDDNGTLDVYLRRLEAPIARVARRAGATVTLAADDPKARSFLCRVDGRAPFLCGPRVTVRRGRVLSVRAGGPGMHFSPVSLRVRLR